MPLSDLAQYVSHHSATRNVPGLRDDLATIGELGVFDNKFHFMVSAWSRSTYATLASWLLRRSAVSSPTQAAAEVSRYLTTSEIECTHVMAIGGIALEADVEVSSAIRVVPFTDAAQGGWVQHIAKLYRGFHENFRPSAAILMHAKYKKDIVNEGDPTPFPPDMYLPLHDVRRCLTVIGPSSPVWLGNWTDLADWVPAFGGGAAIPHPFETGGFPLERVRVDGSDLPTLYAAWKMRGGKEQDHLRVPLDRLSRSLRHIPLVDIAIELGIAIDALFLAEREADRGEQSLTLRLRAARLLGSDEGERRRLGKLFSTLYRARSAAVHSGILAETFDNQNTRRLLAEGAVLASLALRRIIIEGEPDWSALLFQ